MKTKKSIIGVVLTVVLLASLALSMAPVSAAVGTLSYAAVTTPSGQYKALTDVDEIAVAPDGTTMFAYSNFGGMTLGANTGSTSTWDTTLTPQAGTNSAKLVHGTTDGSVYVEFVPAGGITLADLTSIASTPEWSFYHYTPASSSNWAQLELRFTAATNTNPEGAGHVDVTLMPLQSYTGTAAWVKQTVLATSTNAIYYGNKLTTGAAFSDATSGRTLADVVPLIETADDTTTTTGTWQLTRVRLELWEGIVRTSYIDDVTIAGTTYAVEPLIQKLYKSTNAGVTWTTTSIGDGLEGNDVVAMAISPSYATDTTLVAATADKVFRSANGGTSFGEVSTTLLQTAIGAYADGKRITSIDLATYYTGGALAVLIGTYDIDAGQYGGVYVGRLDTWVWVDQAIGSNDVQAVAFSPNHSSDAQIIAVAADATDTRVMTKSATNAWAADVLTATIGTVTDAELTHAVIAFPDDYEWSSNNKFFVGISGVDGTLEDIYRISGGLPGGSSTATDLNLGGSGTENDVYSIAVSGSYIGATVVVGLQDSTSVKRTTDPSLSTVSWSSSTKSPIGDATNPDTTVILAPDFATSNKVYAATDGTNSSFSVSTDGGVYFNGISLIKISALAKLRYLDSAVVDANTIFLLVHDDADGDGAFDAGETQMVFKTTDAGSTWTRVHFVLSTGANGLTILGVSPAYATDSTIYVAQDDTRLWKSTDGGTRFVGLAAPAAITALTVVDASTYFTGHASGIVYKGGNWNSGTAADTIKSIAVVDVNTVFVGNNDGDVYLSTNAAATSGVTYTIQGAAEELGNGATIIVVADPAYATNKTIYAVSTDATTIGIMRWVVGTSTSWTEIDGTATSTYVYASLNGSDVAIAADGSLYASLRIADKGIRRSLVPTSTTVLGRGFESMTSLLPAGAKLQNLSYVTGSNVLYAIASNITSPSSYYPHGYQLLGFSDTFSITPTITAPADGAAIATTSVDLSWEAITAASGTTVTYTYEVSYDAGYANDFVTPTTTTGTTATVTGLTAGTKYYWRVYVAAASPLATRKAGRNFLIQLSVAAQNADLSSPAPGASGVALKPNFQWSPVTNATSYQIQVAATSDFATLLADVTQTTTVYAYPTDLAYSTVYYWRVKAISASTESVWSAGVFTTMAKPVPVVAAPTAPAPQITVQAPPAPEVTVNVPPQAAPVLPAPITPAWIYAIIVVGAVLVIAVIVLIMRTRRVV